MKQFLNKLVEVKIIGRDNFGKKTPGKFITVAGICSFIGPNKNLDIPLQATIGRTPFTLNSLSDIKFQEI